MNPEPTPTPTTTPNSVVSASAAPPRRKPRISLAIATAFGLGYIPKAPGTFGSLAGVALALISPCVSRLFQPASILAVRVGCRVGPCTYDLARRNDPVYFESALFLVISVVGVWTASRVAAYLSSKDPQIVVIDEVAGQYLALVIGALWPFRFEPANIFGPHSLGNFVVYPLNWKCALAGFILFRVFDVWKPFPARQAESLPRGWGTVADDWIAGLYAALGLWILRALGL